MQTLPFQQNTGFNTGALIKRNQQREADNDAIRSAVRAWAAAEGQDVVSAHIIDEWRQQGGEEITFPDDISRARQKLFRYLDNPADSERYREYVRLLTPATSINPAPAMGSLSKTGEVLHTNSPAQGSNSSVIPDTWIPVSEQMPPSRHEVLVGRWWGEKPRWCCKWATYIPGHPDAQSSGWLIPGGSWTPTHWMELPASPQEVR